ncbi:MAG TPA: DUF6209 family protein [Myxococcales bacterium]|jgi:hypothetical protein
MNALKRLGLLVLASLVGCAGEGFVEVDDSIVGSGAPLVGVDGSKDGSDTGCNVVLRSMKRIPNNTGGYVTQGPSGSWVWKAVIDVSDAAVAENLSVAVLYQRSQAWRSKTAAKTTVSEGGFTRFEVDFWEDMPAEGMSGTALRNTRVPVIPYLVLAQGGRLFDHNRIADPVASYVISGEAGLQIGEDAGVCKPASTIPVRDGATVRFTASGVETAGAIAAGSPLTVDYALERLPNCRGTHNGFPAWDLLANVRFLPSGQVVEGSVRAFVNNYGTPTSQAYAVPFTTDVPAGTNRVEIWFRNYSGAGNNCEAWDSNNGQNYGFDVLGAVGWIGNADLAISRGGAGPCDGAALGDGFTYDTWTRQRAAYRNLCFQVWKQGTTDFANPNLWQQIDVQVHFRYGPDLPWQTAYVPSFDRVGNNARYKLDLGSLDPFRSYYCTQEPYAKSADGQYDQASMEFFVVANGVPLKKADGSNFTGTYLDYSMNHCPK